MGEVEISVLAEVDSSVKYHSSKIYILTSTEKNGERQCLVGSFSGALSSQKVTEEFKGQLGANGNRTDSAMA
jgi:hypothetical protein